MKIVTGYTGTPHITANDDQARNQGAFGEGNQVLDVGQKFNATLTDATTVTIEDGDGMIQGVHFRIERGMTEVVPISPGITGYNRVDLICARYTKDAGTGIENVSLVVVEGTPSSSSPSSPSYNTGDVLSGASPVDFPLWKVTLTGLAPVLTKAYMERLQTVRIDEFLSDVTPTQGVYYWSESKTVTVEKGTYIVTGNASITDYTAYPFLVTLQYESDAFEGGQSIDTGTHANDHYFISECDVINVAETTTFTFSMIARGSNQFSMNIASDFTMCRI